MAVPPDEEGRSSTESSGMGRLWRSSPASFMHWYWCTATLYRKSGISSAGINSTRDREMWNFATRTRSSEVAVESHCRAIGSQGPQVFAHSSRNSVLHAPHCISRVRAVHGGTHAGKKVDHGNAPTCHSGGGALGNLAAIGGAPQAVATVGVGERVVERAYASMEEVGPIMCSVWIRLPQLCHAAHLVCMVSMGACFPWKPTSRKGYFPVCLGLLEATAPDILPAGRAPTLTSVTCCGPPVLMAGGRPRHRLHGKVRL